MSEMLDPDRLVEDAIDRAGSDRFGEESWREGFDRLVQALAEEARLTDVGELIAASDVASQLENRARVVAWREAHPEVAGERVERPIVLVGQPASGTAYLYDLLAQDAGLRVPRTWEVAQPCPAPEAATYRTDPRIAEVQSTIDLTDLLLPGFLSSHAVGAELGQECARITGSDFRSAVFATQYRVPSYLDWLLNEADLSPAYAWHRRYLQHLQSRLPGQWLLRSPGHLGFLDALAREYPDVLVIQTHRDPLPVIASASALASQLHGMASDEVSVSEVAAGVAAQLSQELDRGLAARGRGVLPPEQVIDVRYADLVRDPSATLREVYGWLGRELRPEAEAAFAGVTPSAGIGAWADTGLDAGEVRERVAAYQQHYGIEDEALTP